MFIRMAPRTPRKRTDIQSMFDYIGQLLREKDDRSMQNYNDYLDEHESRLRELGDETMPYDWEEQ